MNDYIRGRDCEKCGDPESLCCCEHGSVAGARLVAAAPDLYAALAAIVAEADCHPFNPIGHVVEHVVTTARAALAKARGDEA